MKLLEGKTAVITGASRGIGYSIAKVFAANGCNIAFTDLRYDENMQNAEKALQELGVKAKGYASDASSFMQSEETINRILADFPVIDILVNNAGITRDNLLLRMSEQEWDMVITINLKSVFNLTKACQKVMLKQRFGSIINMSSVVGVNGNAGQANYSASKAGIIGFTKSVAQELGSRNIRCNAIAPGFIETEMTQKIPEDARLKWIANIPLRRSGKPEDVANVALFLASDLSAYVNGQVINVCGGMST
ncbi:MAG TPA: 3-oxoacyl-[acyl-carrier-protein] reductase [Bacteroidales bacterium]|jgi:3-oxoacyl-[acyl-carrier protein] reductase|nr:3-oxoacyl-[acyl-carrier-protein] reductase [Bacteroidales bacterium]HNZ43808.1 3-oxoacyl-[acyl-carrier-protein] reductase [Bacteroidales bacterium]HPI29654.1 3-oxoacyl-[acyl-carrier-protein] reductase [Bacteroidales bacterium]